MKLYASKLAGLDSDVLVDVIEHSISNARSFPTIAELRDNYQREYGRRVRQASDASGLPVVASVCEHGVEGICEECRVSNVVRLREIRESLAEHMDADEAAR